MPCTAHAEIGAVLKTEFLRQFEECGSFSFCAVNARYGEGSISGRRPGSTNAGKPNARS